MDSRCGTEVSAASSNEAGHAQKIPPRIIILDVETTGLSPRNGDKVVELAALELWNGVTVGRTFHTLVNPGRPIPAPASAIHGISNADVRDAPSFEQIVAPFAAFISDRATQVWAHNAAFDRRFITSEFDQAHAAFENEFVCSVGFFRRRLMGRVPNFRLSTIAELAGYQWTGRGAHSALEDCRALAHSIARLGFEH